MIAIYGEILLDILKTNKETKTNVGGAPFNVYYGINKLEGKALFVGNVGNDEYGKYILEFLNKNNLDTSYITNNATSTTLAYVTLDENNDRNFKFIRDAGSDYLLSKEYINLLDNDCIVHIGSLMLSSEYGRNYANELIEKANKKNLIISFDVNYRDDIFKDKKEAIDIYNKIIDKANIVKYSNDEVTLFSNEDDVKKGILKIARNNQKVFVTLGKNGSLLYQDNKFYEVNSIKVSPVDTTGAGDAFYATILTFIDKYGYEVFFNDENIIKDTLKKANIMGAYATLKDGAINSILTLKELETF